MVVPHDGIILSLFFSLLFSLFLLPLTFLRSWEIRFGTPRSDRIIFFYLRNVKGRRKEGESESSYVRKRCWLLRRRKATRQGAHYPPGEDGLQFTSRKKIGLGSCNCEELNSANNPNEGGHAVCVCSCGESCPTLCNLLDYSPPGSSFMGFTNKEYWSGLPFSPTGNLPNLGIEPASLLPPALAGRFFTTSSSCV